MIRGPCWRYTSAATYVLSAVATLGAAVAGIVALRSTRKPVRVGGHFLVAAMTIAWPVELALSH